MTPTQPMNTAPIAVLSSLAPAKMEVGSQAEPAEEQRMVLPTPIACSRFTPVGKENWRVAAKRIGVQAWDCHS